MLGIDVDAQLVSRARANLKDLLQQERVKKAFEALPGTGRPAAADTAPERAADREMTASEDVSVRDAESAQEGGQRSVFAAEMPLSFRLWKAPVQTAASVPKGLGKVSTGYVWSSDWWCNWYNWYNL